MGRPHCPGGVPSAVQVRPAVQSVGWLEGYSVHSSLGVDVEGTVPWWVAGGGIGRFEILVCICSSIVPGGVLV